MQEQRPRPTYTAISFLPTQNISRMTVLAPRDYKGGACDIPEEENTKSMVAIKAVEASTFLYNHFETTHVYRPPFIGALWVGLSGDILHGSGIQTYAVHSQA